MFNLKINTQLKTPIQPPNAPPLLGASSKNLVDGTHKTFAKFKIKFQPPARQL